jgi:LmbE family N-acetylglucosaminyl deacetylase
VATVLAFHAHPDDEVLLTGGTLARLAAEGHRAVIAVACDGVMGEAIGGEARIRLDELRTSASVLGVARVVHLGYADSGYGPRLYPDPPDRVRFARADVDEAAAKLAELIRDEQADLLLSYDPRGGYGHRDHLKVHEVGSRAAEMVGTIPILEATLPREPLVRLFNVVRRFGLARRYDPKVIRTAYTSRSAITHRVDVHAFASQKRAALKAHRSQVSARTTAGRVFRTLLTLPTPVFGLLLGREWFVDPTSPVLQPSASRPAAFVPVVRAVAPPS